MGRALNANLATAFMVVFASRLGMPVSTTHVSVGAITGVGIINGTADKSVIGGILLSWILTLPICGGHCGDDVLAAAQTFPWRSVPADQSRTA
jgi:PiT family inorganic phosphate transporter